MALDMVAYKALALQQIVRRREVIDQLPPILSVVFYDGFAPWNEATSLSDLVASIEGLPDGLDFLSYRLIDAQRLDLEDLLDSESPLLGIFRLERLRSVEDLAPAMRSLATVLGPDEAKLREALVAFVNRSVLPRLTPDDQRPHQIRDLEEIPPMFAQRLDKIVEDLKTQAQLEGRETGLQEGRQEGRMNFLRHLLESKFGKLPAEAFARLEKADSDQLMSWGERVLTARTLPEVFS